MLCRMLVSMLFACLVSAVNAASVTVVDIPSRGIKVRIALITPDHPNAVLMALPGNNGVIGIDSTFGIDDLASAYASNGVAVAYVDAPSDLSGGMPLGFRESSEHAADLLAVITYLRDKLHVPIWLGGFSNGTISAAYGGIVLPSDVPFGVVLAATVTAQNQFPVLGLNLEKLRRPVFVIHHALDTCPASPPALVPVLMSRLTGAPVAELQMVTGGPGGVREGCDGHHGFEGQDGEIASAISAFIGKYSYLVPPDPAGVAVEFYHPELDHYFVTHRSDEIAILDAGVQIKGWRRTQQTFRVFTAAGTRTSPVCRYYIPPEKGNSHFYGRGAQECDATGATNPTFVNEDPQFFFVILPTAGACPVGTVAVYRVFDNRIDANHRYMVDRNVRDGMVSGEHWTAEGDGPDRVVMCVPS